MPAIRKRSGLTLFACAVAFLLPVAFSPSVHATFWTPKAALLPIVAAVGLPRLIALARFTSPVRPAARAAVAFVGIASLSTLLADNHTTAVFGLYLWGTGLIFVMALAGAWAIGVSLDENGRNDVTRALLVGIVVNVFFALLEMVGDLSSFELARYDGRSIGLMGNPVHLGALAAGGLALALPWHGRRLWPWLILTAAIAATIEVSGSRAALMSVVSILALTASIRALRDLLGIKRLITVVVALSIGFGGGAVLTEWGGGVSVSGRVTQADGGGGVTPRLSMWWATRHAIANKPLLGSGPGTYREATSKFRTVEVARAFGADNYFTDAHNLVVEYMTTTGILGFATFLAWVLLAWKQAHLYSRLFSLAVLLVGLVEPQFPGVTPLAFLVLGITVTPLSTREDAAVAGSISLSRQQLQTSSQKAQMLSTAVTSVLVLLSTVGAASFLVGEFHLEQASLDFNRHHADRSLALLPRWPRPAAVRGRIETFEGRATKDPAKLAMALHWQKEAIRRDPTNPFSWLVLGDAASSEGRASDAVKAYRHVLEINPMSTRACNGLASLANLAGQTDNAEIWLLRSLKIDPDQPSVRQALRRIQSQPD